MSSSTSAIPSNSTAKKEWCANALHSETPRRSTGETTGPASRLVRLKRGRLDAIVGERSAANPMHSVHYFMPDRHKVLNLIDLCAGGTGTSAMIVPRERGASIFHAAPRITLAACLCRLGTTVLRDICPTCIRDERSYVSKLQASRARLRARRVKSVCAGIAAGMHRLGGMAAPFRCYIVSYRPALWPGAGTCGRRNRLLPKRHLFPLHLSPSIFILRRCLNR